MALSFPRSLRLVRSGEYARVRAKGRTFGGRYMVLSLLRLTPSDDQTQRFGFITSRKVGNAVVRNRVRRRLREIVRTHRPEIPSGIWLVIIARYTASSASYAALSEEWNRLARRARLL